MANKIIFCLVLVSSLCFANDECEDGFELVGEECLPMQAPEIPAIAQEFNTGYVIGAAAASVTAVGTYLIYYLCNRNTRHELSEVDDYLNQFDNIAIKTAPWQNNNFLTPEEIGRRMKEASETAGIKALKNVNPANPEALGRAFEKIKDIAKIAAFWGAFNNPSPRRNR
ncbi:MAG: hypothetical protein WCK49_01265 [Myxococcaceae bacterium]